MKTATMAACIAVGCTADIPFLGTDYCEDHEYEGVTTCSWSRWSYNNPPEQCNEEAEPGTERCSMHSEDLMGDDEDTHDYWD